MLCSSTAKGSYTTGLGEEKEGERPGDVSEEVRGEDTGEAGGNKDGSCD
jgi:hypothetical protein